MSRKWIYFFPLQYQVWRLYGFVAPDLGITHNSRRGQKGKKNRGEQEDITVEWDVLPNWLIRGYLHSALGRSIAHVVNFGYNTGARGVEINLTLKRVCTR